MTNNIGKLTNEIGTITANLVQATEDLKNLKKQLALLLAKKTGLIRMRKEDQSAYRKRSSQQTKVLQALKEIVKTLSVRVAKGNTAFVQKEEILEILKKIGNNNPFAALVEFTMSFDIKEVNHVIAKLNELEQAISASLGEDIKQEVVSTNQYTLLLAEMEKVHKNLLSEIAKTTISIKNLKSNLLSKRKSRSEQMALRTRAQNSLKSTKEAQVTYNSIYTQETKERRDEMATILKVIKIIRTHTGAINRSSKLPTKI